VSLSLVEFPTDALISKINKDSLGSGSSLKDLKLTKLSFKILSALLVTTIFIAVPNAHAEDLQNCIKGQAAFNAKQYDLSTTFYTACISSGNLGEHYKAIAYQMRGIAYSRQNKTDNAIRDLNEALNIRPKNAETLGERGQAWAIKGKYENAVRDYSASLELNPKDIGTALNRGLSYEALGRVQEAILDFKAAYGMGSRWKPMLDKLKKYASASSQKNKYQVTWNLPGNFHLVHKDENKMQTIYQYTPKGETVKNWGQMITLGVLRLEKPVLNIAKVHLNATLSGFRAPCASSEVLQIKLAATEIPSNVGAVLCDGLDQSKVPKHIYTRKNGFIFIKNFETPDMIYTFQYEWQDNALPSSHVKKSGLLEDTVIPLMDTANVIYVSK